MASLCEWNQEFALCPALAVKFGGGHAELPAVPYALQGSYREGANGAQGSGDLAVGGLRFHMAHSSSGDLRNGAQPHVPGSPGPSGRGDEPQHARSESLGSDTHLQVPPCTL